VLNKQLIARMFLKHLFDEAADKDNITINEEQLLGLYEALGGDWREDFS